MKVLIATGAEDVDRRLSRSARRVGWEAILAQDGPTALELALTLRPELCVLGESLAWQSGWLVCAKLTIAGYEGSVVLAGQSRPELGDMYLDAAGACRFVNLDDCEGEFARMLGATQPAVAGQGGQIGGD